MMISVHTLINFICVRFSQLLGHNSQSTANGLEIPLVDHTLLKLNKKTRTLKEVQRTILMIDGSIILNLDYR